MVGRGGQRAGGGGTISYSSPRSLAATSQPQPTCRLLLPVAELTGDGLGEHLACGALLVLKVFLQLLRPVLGNVGVRVLSSCIEKLLLSISMSRAAAAVRQ